MILLCITRNSVWPSLILVCRIAVFYNRRKTYYTEDGVETVREFLHLVLGLTPSSAVDVIAVTCKVGGSLRAPLNSALATTQTRMSRLLPPLYITLCISSYGPQRRGRLRPLVQ